MPLPPNGRADGEDLVLRPLSQPITPWAQALANAPSTQDFATEQTAEGNLKQFLTAKRGGGGAGSADKLEARIELMNKLEKWKVLQWLGGKHPFNGRPSNHCSSPHATSRHWLSSRLLPVVLTPLSHPNQLSTSPSSDTAGLKRVDARLAACLRTSKTAEEKGRKVRGSSVTCTSRALWTGRFKRSYRMR